MRVSAKGEYALKALHYLTLHHGEGFIQIKDISAKQRIPLKFLEGILLKLKKAGYLKSKRGAGGGYVLAKHPANINLAEIMRSMEIPLTPIDCVNETTPAFCCQDKENCEFISIWMDIKKRIEDVLENTSFEDLVTKSNRSRKIAV